MKKIATLPKEAVTRLIAKAIQTVKDHMAEENFTSADLAMHLNMSRNRLYSYLRPCNITPKQIIDQVKLGHAKYLLSHHPEMPIEEISDQIGCTSPFIFYKYFLRHIGVSPVQYRKHNTLIVSL